LAVFARIVVGLVAGVAIAALASHCHYARLADAESARVDAALGKTNLSPTELRADIAEFQRLMLDVHPAAIRSLPFDDPGPALDELSAAIDAPLDHLQFYRRLAPVANRLNDEHTMVFPSELDRARLAGPEAGRLPLDVALIDGRLYVARNYSDVASIRPGDEVLSINGHAAGYILETLSGYYSGTRLQQKQYYAVADFAAGLPLVLDIGGPYQVRLLSRDTETASLQELPGIESSDDTGDPFSVSQPAAGTMLFAWHAFEDDENQFDEFLASMFESARADNIQALIIDIRDNQGGAAEYGDDVIEYLIEAPFSQLERVEVTVSEDVRAEFLGYVPGALRWLPIQYLHPWLRPLWTSEPGESVVIPMDPVVPPDDVPRFSGDVFLLIGPGTMSSASLFAATLKQLDLATLVGEATGGHATMYGNLVDARLPNSGLKVWMPTSVVAGLAAGPVTPDHRVAQSARDVAGSKDAVLEFALGLATGQVND
jgi:hypothetical protein